MSIFCTICLGPLALQQDVVHTTSCGHIFHQQCLSHAIRSSPSCPQCRHPNIQHFQLFFSIDKVENDDSNAGAGALVTQNDATTLSRQISEVSRKLDNLSASLSTPRRGSSVTGGRGEVQMYRDIVDQLQQENQDLKEILEMEKILSSNSEREIERLKLDIRERNDIINALQVQNDILRDETNLYEAGSSKIAVVNLLDL